MALNLVQQRGQPSIWDDKAADWSDMDFERWLAAIAAGALFISGVRRRSLGGLLLALGSSGLAWWAVGGSDERRIRRAHVRATIPPRAGLADDIVHEAAEESFPASDPPSWTSTTGHAGPQETLPHR
jgi:hypothetical protein